jgi:CPA1 family monovalent cation:H+ antiporter
MRGIVTLAAAIALPPSFPQRDLILFTAFFVVLGTLVLQGLTLKTLLRALDLRDGDPVSVESRTARKRVLEAALAAAPGGSSEAVDLVRTAFKVRLVAGTQAAVRPEPVRTYATAYRLALHAARNAYQGSHKRRPGFLARIQGRSWARSAGECVLALNTGARSS